MSRREKLEKMLTEEPDDVFLQYALATELLKEGSRMAAFRQFNEIHSRFPDYVPAWFRHAQAAAEAGEMEHARELGSSGLEAARRTNDHHAAGEISQFLEMMS